MIHSIILDYGGTLDTDGSHWSKVISRGWEQAGVMANAALFREAYVFAEQQLNRSLEILPHYNFNDLMQVKIKLELQYLASHGYFPPQEIEAKGTEIASYCYEVAKQQTQKNIPVLEKLSSRYNLVLVSNFYGNLESVLKDFGLMKYFKKVYDSKKVGKRKPDSGIFELAVKDLGGDSSEILVVGDSYENDIAPAKKLGCQTLWLKNDSNDYSHILTEEEVTTIRTLDDILNFLEGDNEIS